MSRNVFRDPVIFFSFFNEGREAFFLLFFQGKKSLFIRGHARRVGCLFIFSVSLFICMFVSVNIVIGHLGRPRSTHTAPMPVPIGSVHAQMHAQTITKPSRAGLPVSRSELVEPGAATCVLEAWLGRVSNFKSLERMYQVRRTSRA